MSYTTIGKAVVFLDVYEQSAAYPSGGKVRVMLHGSAVHLVGSDPPPRTSVDELSEQAAAHSTIYADAFASLFNHFFDLIEYGSRLDINNLEEDRMWSFKNHIRAASPYDVLPTLSNHLRLPHTAAWMAGLARITAVASTDGHHSILFATPLYVEHVSPPPPDR